MKPTVISLLRNFVLAFAVLIAAATMASAQTVLFTENGEGLADGQAVPGWTICEGACASVTATTAVKKVGDVGIRVNGDNFRLKPLPMTFTGPLEVSLWMFPATDGNTNYAFHLGSVTNSGVINIRINESNNWFLTPPGGCGPGSSVGGCGGNGWVLGPYSMDWTHVRLVLNPTRETVDAFLNGVQVASGVSTLGPSGERLLSEGISIIGTSSGRGGAGHDSFFDELVITSSSGAKDTTPPVISSLTASPTTLWPPDHKMVAVTLNAVATDNVGVTSLKIVTVTSNEPDNGLGDGDTPFDIQITGDLRLNLRAERSGTGNGRTYAITVEARDAAGNRTLRTTNVTVPKSQSGK